MRVLPAEANPALGWLESRRRAAALHCTPIRFSECREWYLRAGRFVRHQGGFFTVDGYRIGSSDPGWDGATEVLIDQPEVGILGFLVRRRAGRTEILLQAKDEPGNVGTTQLAPTVQATLSNYTRIHRGSPTRYLERFLRPGERTVTDVEQSEHGTCFRGKYNRNVTVHAGGSEPIDPSPVHAWHWREDLLAALDVDFAVNTDARSVLCTTDWALFTEGGEPFGRWRGTGSFGDLLRESYAGVADSESFAAAKWVRRRQASSLFHLRREPIDELPGWEMTEGGAVDSTRSMSVRLFAINASDREVPSWQQPLVGRCAEGRAVLLCQVRDGALEFLVRASREPGFAEGLQLGPTAVSRHRSFEDTPLNDFCLDPHRGSVVACVRQSDEGGRFFQTTTEYQVRLIPEDDPPPPDPEAIWLTLGQLHRLAQLRSMTNNELRSVLSTLLTWL